jgi:hypothetical protein
VASFAAGRVIEITDSQEDLVKARVALDDEEIEAHGYPLMLGRLSPGDRVVVNTTGLRLALGTGGVGFLLWNLDGSGPPGIGEGHIVKMRYTPWQTNVLAAEEPSSPHHRALSGARSLHGAPVVACGLHSQIAGVAAGVKAAAPGARVGYLMSDGGALPLAWSELARRLVAAGLIDVTCTHGHAFGGDLEAVNVFSGLVALRAAGEADVVVAAMGPGTAGTGTVLGSTSLEQGQTLDATRALEGRAVACLRVSFADERERHRGVSHHSLTSLCVVARERCTVAVPDLSAEQSRIVHEQLGAGVEARHELQHADGRPGVELLEEAGVHPTSMGRGVRETPEPFLAAAAAGSVAARYL